MEKFKNFLIEYRGAIIGGLVSIVALLLKFYQVLLYISIVIAGILLGNYIQHNKESVKDKIKTYIDRL